MLLAITGSERGPGASSLKGFISSAHNMFFRTGRFYESQCVFSSVSRGDSTNAEGVQKSSCSTSACLMPEALQTWPEPSIEGSQAKDLRA